MQFNFCHPATTFKLSQNKRKFQETFILCAIYLQGDTTTYSSKHERQQQMATLFRNVVEKILSECINNRSLWTWLTEDGMINLEISNDGRKKSGDEHLGHFTTISKILEANSTPVNLLLYHLRTSLNMSTPAKHPKRKNKQTNGEKDVALSHNIWQA